jgi:RNA polymerase sigma-70 factor (ECF subfamily)
MKNRDLSDKSLIQRYQAGDESSLELLIHRHKDRIYGYIMMVMKDRQLADDVFQDTFVKVIHTLKAGSYREEGKFLQWVMRIAHNLMIDHFRRAKRMPKFNSSREDFDIFDTIREKSDSVEQRMIKEQIHQDIRKLIEYLPEEQKEVLKMRHYAKMSFKDIAEVTDVSINTALGRMRYALINLRKMIKEKDLLITG